MEAFIDKGGNFFIKRGNRLKNQACPYDAETYCGDWCPLFGEPVKIRTETTAINICRRLLEFKSFGDERP